MKQQIATQWVCPDCIRAEEPADEIAGTGSPTLGPQDPTPLPCKRCGEAPATTRVRVFQEVA